MLKKYVGTRVHEELNALLLCRFADSTEPPGLSIDTIKPRAFDDPILEIDANYTQIDKARNVVRKLSSSL
jgi:hypothetical protein